MRVIGSIVDYVLAIGNVERFARLLMDPELAIFSLTITEGGYSLARENPTLEAIATGLEARRLAGEAPLTILSCDNLPGNGTTAGGAITTVCQSRSRGACALCRGVLHLSELDGRQDHAADRRRQIVPGSRK